MGGAGCRNENAIGHWARKSGSQLQQEMQLKDTQPKIY